MINSNQPARRLSLSPRWSLLALTISLPLIILSIFLRSVGAVEVEPLMPEATVSGVVVNPDGSTITDTSGICLTHFHPDGWPDWEICKDSDVSGNFSFTETIPGEFIPGAFVVQAQAPWNSPYFGSLPNPIPINSNGDIIPMGNITLTHASFEGMVYEPDGVTLADYGGVSLFGMLNDEVAWGEYLTGTYAVGGVPTGVFMLLAHPPEDSIFWNSAPISVSIAAGSQYDPNATQPISLTLQDANLTGTVVYPSGAPVTWIISGTDEVIGRARGRAVSADWSVDLDRPTASWGEFGLLAPPGSYMVWAEPEGTVAMSYTGSLPRPISVSVAAGTGPLTLTYPSFTGIVVDPAGTPITDCLDIWLEDMTTGEWFTNYWYCGDQGLPYLLGGVPAGNYWLQSGGIPHLGLFPAQPISVTVLPGSQYIQAATQNITLTLVGPQLSVFVEAPGGIPIPANVELWNDWGYEERQPSTPGNPARFGGLPAGNYWIRAWPQESDIPALANSIKTPVSLGAGLITRTLALRLPDITGVVETPEGNPLPPAFDWDGNPVPHPAQVNVHNASWTVDLWTTTNITGEFSLALPPGNYELLAYPMWSLEMTYTKSSLVPFMVSNIGPPQNLGFISLTYPRIVGVVETPAGTRVSAWVNMWSEDGSYWDGDDTFWYPPDADEPFRFGGMPPGHYFVRADPPWDNPEGLGSSNIYDFFVPPTSTEQITLVLQMANFVGELRFPPGSPCPDCPVPGTDVQVRTQDRSFEDWAGTGNDGRFAFSGLMTDTYILDFFLPPELQVNWEPPPPPVTFTLASATDQITRTLYLTRALRTKRVIGEVVYDDTGAGVPNARVYAYQEYNGQWAEAPTNPDGSYDFYLGGGLWRLGVEPVDPADPGIDWFFHPDWEQWVWFPFTRTLEITETVIFTVPRSIFFQVTGGVDDPYNNPPPPDTTWVDLCDDEGLCFGAPVAANGRFTVTAIPGVYYVWVWVDPATGFLPPLEGDPILVDNNIDLGLLQLRDPADRTARVSGRVILTPTGQGLAGVRMEGWTDEGDWATAQTITNGQYAIDLFPGFWHGGPILTPEQQDEYVVLPPRYRHGLVLPGETISNVNFFLQRRDATIQGHVVDGAGNILDVEAVAFAEYCTNVNCWTVDESEVMGGAFELNVIGDFTYTVGIWLMSGGYIPDPPLPVYVSIGEITDPPVEIILQEAGTEIYGCLVTPTDTACVNDVEASVFASDPDENWVEDYIWPGKSDYRLWVTEGTTWTLDLWLDPSSGYIVSPTYQGEDIWVPTGTATITRNLPIVPLDAIIIGTVSTNPPVPYTWVFAEGISGTEGLYFEAETDANGVFTMTVLSGDYLVGAYLPPHLKDNFFPPPVQIWSSEADNPVDLLFRPRPAGAQATEIIGDLSVVPAGSLANDTPIYVFGWADDGSFNEVTGTLATGYRMPVISNTTWYIWAAYEDPENDAFFHSIEKVVDVGSADVTGIDLALVQAGAPLPDAICETFDPSRFKRISLPAWGDLPEPLIEIQAGTMPVSDTVQICATPTAAVPDGQYLAGFAYELEARDSQGNLITENFNKSVRFIFYYSADVIPPGTDPADLQPRFYSTARQEWISLEDVFVDPESWFVTGKINHFSRFGAMMVPSGSSSASTNIYLPLIIKN